MAVLRTAAAFGKLIPVAEGFTDIFQLHFLKKLLTFLELYGIL